MNKLKEKYIKKFIRFLKENELYDNIDYKDLILFNIEHWYLPCDFKCSIFGDNEINDIWVNLISDELTNDVYNVLKEVIDEEKYNRITKNITYFVNLKENIRNYINRHNLHIFLYHVDYLKVGYNEDIILPYNNSHTTTLQYLIYQFNHE